jgi:hypothetical protein
MLILCRRGSGGIGDRFLAANSYSRELDSVTIFSKFPHLGVLVQNSEALNWRGISQA